MKVLTTSDTHLHAFSAHSIRLPNGLNSRLFDGLKILEQLGDAAREHNADLILIAGDLFESRVTLALEVLHEAHVAIRKLATERPVILLRGNHDMASRVGHVMSLEPFRDISGVTVIDRPQMAHGIYCIPYHPDVQVLRDWLTTAPTCAVLTVHATFREAVAGPCDRTIRGDHVSLDDVPWDRVGYLIAGDIHKRQQLSDRAEYVGSPLQLNFGERGEEKAFTLYDTATKERTVIPTSAPRFYWLKDSFDLPEDFRPDVDFLRVSYLAKDELVAQALKQQYPRTELVLQRETVRATTRVSTEELSVGGDKRLLQAYLEQTPPNELDPESCLSVGLELLSEVAV